MATGGLWRWTARLLLFAVVLALLTLKLLVPEL